VLVTDNLITPSAVADNHLLSLLMEGLAKH